MAIVTKTPGVYIEEISIFPPSIAQVETAVPAFIGYTEFARNRGESLLLKPTRLRSLVEYEQFFGGGPEVKVKEVILDGLNNVVSAELEGSFLLYDSLRLFFSNGGSKCYIISIGTYGKDGNGAPVVNFPDFEVGLQELRTQDEPTL